VDRHSSPALQEDRFLDQVACVPPTPEAQDALADVLESVGVVSQLGESALPVLAKQFPLLLQASLHHVFESRVEGVATVD
jgi:hypothetical protein